MLLSLVVLIETGHWARVMYKGDEGCGNPAEYEKEEDVSMVLQRQRGVREGAMSVMTDGCEEDEGK
jgi:hypothetical protein